MKEQWEMEWKDYYKILMVDVNADKDVIDAAYKRLASKHHPDNVRHGDAFTMRRLNEAAEVLRDRDRRAKYDGEHRKRRGSDRGDAANRVAQVEAQLRQAQSQLKQAQSQVKQAQSEAEAARRGEQAAHQEALDALRDAHGKEKAFVATEACLRQDEVSAGLGARKDLVLNLARRVSMEFVLIPAGKFLMGSPETETDRASDEGTPREVTISRRFYMGVYEVTQTQYEAVVGSRPSHFRRNANPVESVSWDDAVDFCEVLSAKNGKKVRLPTEAEWEYACRAGTKTRFVSGDYVADLGHYAWYEGNSGGETRPVGCNRPNAFGLYDMHGNVREWCSDWYDSDANAKEEVDPAGPNMGTHRVVRGGSWDRSPWYCRSAHRGGFDPGCRTGSIGFRVVVEVGGVD
jgi:formylglycine-generating enzyme required for sulfatase activity